MLGERIEARRKELGISQAELGRRARVPQTTMNSIIAKSPRSTPHLVRIATALSTTPAYQMGETDDPDRDAPDAPSLSPDQLELMEYYDRLSRADRQLFLQPARSMAEKTTSPPPTGGAQAGEQMIGSQRA